MPSMKQKLMTGAAMAAMGVSMAFGALAVENVDVVTGGVGATSQMMIQAAEKDHSLKLVFTGDKGMYLSDVKVSITDAAGNLIVSSVTDGPMLLAALQPGKYTVTAEAEGFTKTQKVQVGEAMKTLQLSFPMIKDDIDYSSNTDMKW